MDSRKQVTFRERESVWQDLQEPCKTNKAGRTSGFQIPKIHDSADALETLQKMSSKVVSPIPPPFDIYSGVQTATPECASQQATKSQEGEQKLVAISTSDHCLTQRDPPKQQEFGTENPKKGDKKRNTLAEGEAEMGKGKEWKTQKDQTDSDLPATLITLQTDGLIQMGEVKKNLQSRLDEIQVSYQTGVDKLQNVFESSNSQVELTVEKVSSAVKSVETTLRSMDSNLVKINSNLVQLQETVEFGFKELTKEVASLVRWLCQNLSAGPVENHTMSQRSQADIVCYIIPYHNFLFPTEMIQKPHPGLKTGQKRYLFSIANIYSTDHMHRLMERQYLNMLQYRTKLGYITSHQSQKYSDYIRKQSQKETWRQNSNNSSTARSSVKESPTLQPGEPISLSMLRNSSQRWGVPDHGHLFGSGPSKFTKSLHGRKMNIGNLGSSFSFRPTSKYDSKWTKSNENDLKHNQDVNYS